MLVAAVPSEELALMKISTLLTGASLALVALFCSVPQTRADFVVDQQFLANNSSTRFTTGVTNDPIRFVQTFTVGVA
jgi:hypothetical protein